LGGSNKSYTKGGLKERRVHPSFEAAVMAAKKKTWKRFGKGCDPQATRDPSDATVGGRLRDSARCTTTRGEVRLVYCRKKRLQREKQLRTKKKKNAPQFEEKEIRPKLGETRRAVQRTTSEEAWRGTKREIAKSLESLGKGAEHDIKGGNGIQKAETSEMR